MRAVRWAPVVVALCAALFLRGRRDALKRQSEVWASATDTVAPAGQQR